MKISTFASAVSKFITNHRLAVAPGPACDIIKSPSSRHTFRKRSPASAAGNEIQRRFLHRMLDHQPPAVQRDSVGKLSPRAILSVSNKGMTARRQLYTNLMLSSRFQPDFHQAESASTFNRRY